MLEEFFAPRSIAVIGASREAGKVGRFVFDNLLAAGFPGDLYPVNPKADEIRGRRSYPSVADVPERVDLAVVVVPAKRVAAVLEECGTSGVKAAIVISAGFKETGPSGAALEREAMEVARRHGIRVIGPNCLGVIAARERLNASFAPSMPHPGGLSLMSQSGALGTAILDWIAGEGIGMDDFVSLGNKADVSEVDLLRAWVDDPDTTVVAAYLESVSDGAGFVEAACRLSERKPLIVVKSGGSEAGARAVSSHTGSLAGSERAYEAAFRKAGIVRAFTVEQLFDYSAAFARQSLPHGDGVAILTNAGGPAIMATDACERLGMPLASLDGPTIESLRAVLPDAAALYNPVDVLGDAGADRYEAAARLLYADPGVSALLVILTPQAMTEAYKTAETVAALASESGKTTLACFMGGPLVEPAAALLAQKGVPAYPFPERAASALAAMRRYAEHRSCPIPPAVRPEVDTEAARVVIDRSVAAGRPFIVEQDAADVASAYGLRVPAGKLARNLAEARGAARTIGYPLVMKIASPDILHKSDIGGIRVGISGDEELEEAYETIMTSVRTRMRDAVVWGVYVQEMVSGGREVIIGVNRDPSFGPLLMFGMGGIYVEVLKDVTFRLCPVSQDEARQMITEIRSFGLLRGARGEKPADVDAIAEAMVRVSAMAVDHEEILELDINPLTVMEKGGGAIAVDVRIGIGGR